METSLRKGTPRPAGQGKSRIANRRRRIKMAQRKCAEIAPMRAIPVRRSRQRKRGQAQIRNAFVRCVIDPFNHVGPLTGVPDRFSGLSLVMENRTILLIDKPKKFNYFLVTPCLGANLIWQGFDSEELIFKSDTEGVEWSSRSPTIDDDDAVQMFSQYRTISLAFKIRYVGPAAVRNGIIRTSRFNIVSNNQQFEVKQDNAQNRVIEWDTVALDQTTQMALPSASENTMTEGAYGLAVRTAGDSWNFHEVFPFITAVSTQDLAAELAKTTPSVKWFNFTVAGMDPDWTSLLTSVYLPTASNAYFGNPSIEIEVRHCFEAVPSVTSTAKPFRTLARQSPRTDEVALNQIADIQRELPATIPNQASWLDKLGQGLGRFAGRVASGFVEPLTSLFSGFTIGAPSFRSNTGLPALM